MLKWQQLVGFKAKPLTFMRAMDKSFKTKPQFQGDKNNYVALGFGGQREKRTCVLKDLFLNNPLSRSQRSPILVPHGHSRAGCILAGSDHRGASHIKDEANDLSARDVFSTLYLILILHHKMYKYFGRPWLCDF